MGALHANHCSKMYFFDVFFVKGEIYCYFTWRQSPLQRKQDRFTTCFKTCGMGSWCKNVFLDCLNSHKCARFKTLIKTPCFITNWQKRRKRAIYKTLKKIILIRERHVKHLFAGLKHSIHQ